MSTALALKNRMTQLIAGLPQSELKLGNQRRRARMCLRVEVVMGVVGYLVALLLAGVTHAGAWYSYITLQKTAGVSQETLSNSFVAVGSSGAACVAAVVFLIAHVTYYNEKDKAWREQRRKLLGDELYGLLARIRKESGNFERLREKPPAAGFNEYTEVTPFELLDKELVKIQDVWRYYWKVRRLRKEIKRIQEMPRGRKDVTAFMPLLERLEKQLEYDVKGYPPPTK